MLWYRKYLVPADNVLEKIKAKFQKHSVHDFLILLHVCTKRGKYLTNILIIFVVIMLTFTYMSKTKYNVDIDNSMMILC